MLRISALLVGFALLSICLLSFNLEAQEVLSQFSPFKGEDRLNNTECHSALLDSRGWMWFGTQDGLFRFDGHTYKYFQFKKTDSTALQGNIIMDIVEDDKGGLWLASLGGGLSYYDPQQDHFSSFRNLSDSSNRSSDQALSSLLLDSDRQLWLGTYNAGFNFFDPVSKRFQNFPLSPNLIDQTEAFKTNSVMDILEDVVHKNILWIAGNNGLYRFNKEKMQLDGYYPVPNKSSSKDTPPRVAVLKLFMDQADELWLGTWEKGLVKFNTAKQVFEKTYLPDQIQSQNLWKSNVINGIARKSKEEFWISDKINGVGIFNTKRERFSFKPKKNIGQYGGKAYDEISGIYLDPDKRLWAFYRYSGIQLLNPSHQLFQAIDLKPAICDFPSDNQINALAKDDQRGLVYAASNSCSEFYIYNIQSKELQKSLPKNLISSSLDFKKIFVDSEGVVWVAGKDIVSNKAFLVNYLPEKKLWQNYEQTIFYQHFQKPPEISDILEGQQKELWFGSASSGLIKLDANRKQLFHYQPGPKDAALELPLEQISRIIESSSGTIWMGTYGNGVFMFNPKNQSFSHYKHYPWKDYGLNHGYITSLAEGADGKIWTAFRTQGIQLIDPALPDTQLMETIRYEDGLPDEKIAGLIKDFQGNIWLSSWKGLCKYNSANKRFALFTENHGLNDHFLVNKALEISANGEILLGQNNSFLFFQPSQFCKEVAPTQISFSYLKIFEEKQTFDPLTDRLQLAHNQNFFTVGFAASTFFQSENSQFAYYLKGYDKDWVYTTDNRHYATYSNVNPGQYTFHLKAANYCGDWQEESLSLKIGIRAPWWQSIGAYLFYLLFFLLILYSLFQYQKKRLKLQSQLEIERQEALRLKELDSWKTRLYTNITHEFRTPLSVILGMTQKLPDHFRDGQTSKVNKAVELISRNGKQLLLLINQLLDLSKIDSKSMPLNMVQGDLIPFLKYVTESFHSLAESKNVRLYFSRDLERIQMDYDPEKIQQIVFNLLSNAIKFTPADGIVNLHVGLSSKSNQHIAIQVRDTGEGISAEQLPSIFDRFFQVDDSTTRNVGGTGIGLALTKELVQLLNGEIEVSSLPGEGSTFVVLLPLSNNAPMIKPNTGVQKDAFADLALGSLENHNGEEVFSEEVHQAERPEVLLVEDNADVVHYLLSCLSENYTVSVATDGQAGIDLAIESIPDLIISDVMMPKKNGFDLCTTLKKDKRTSHIPIILLTAKASIEDKMQGLEGGADAYLSKPFHHEELLLRIEKLIELRRMFRDRYQLASDKKAPIPPMDQSLKIEDEFVQKIRLLVEENMGNEQFGVDDISKAIFLSRTQVHRKLKALTGKSTGQFIRAIRLQQAMEWLNSSEKSITAIAFDTGFKDPAYFSRVFAEVFGQPPSSVRK